MMLLPALVAVLLGSLTLAFVLYPLYRHTPVEVLQQGASTVMPFTQAEREQTARAALKEVELDYQLGNLAETDYRTLRERYTRRAFVAMKSRRENEVAIDALIEERLRQLREEQDHQENMAAHEIATTGDDNATGKSDDATENQHDATGNDDDPM